MTLPVVRAIDVGFGLVKLSVRAGDGVGFTSFPSMAVPADASAVRSLGTRRRDTFDVPVNGANYEVGRDVRLAQAGGSFGRDVTDEFYRGAIYEALAKGALRYMAEAGDSVIDVLVLGLPVNQYNDGKRRDYLRSQYEGDIQLGDGKKITVRKVFVQAQPMGGYAALGDHLDDLNRAISKTAGALKPLEDGEALDDLCGSDDRSGRTHPGLVDDSTRHHQSACEWRSVGRGPSPCGSLGAGIARG